MAKFPARLPRSRLEKPRSREPSQPALLYEGIENFPKDLEVRRVSKTGLPRSTGFIWRGPKWALIEFRSNTVKNLLRLFFCLFYRCVVFKSVWYARQFEYSMWSLVRASPRCPWSATFPKMIKYFVEKKNTLNNERYRDLLISILSYDEVSAFLLWVKTRN